MPGTSKLTMGLLHAFLILFGIIWIYPFVWTVFSSLKTNTEMINAGIKLLPGKAQWGNYVRAWHEANFSGFFSNTVIITVSSVLLVVAMCALQGYALGRVNFPGRKWLVAAITATMFIPKGYTLLPVYIIIKQLGLLSSLPGVILAESSGAHVLFILLFMAYFNKLPMELEEAAEIDGSGFVRTFARVMLPLAKPMIATTAIMQFIWAWNAFLIPLVFTLSKPELQTLAVGMFTFVGEHSIDWVGMCAGATISLIPVIVVFVALQKYFIEGVAGSIKG